MNNQRNAEYREKVENLLSQMTTEEKVAQMLQLSAGGANPEDLFNECKKEGLLGSYLHVLGEETGEYIDGAKNSRLKIPPIFGIDAIHGHALLKQSTIFPNQLGMASSWDPEMLEKVGEITATEVWADGLNWVFSPVLCLGRDLRWGRIDETFGEDAELAARLGAGIIKGYQKSGKVAACAKHYLGYGEATGGRDSYDTEITERKAREVFLKPFKAAVDVGCMTFMTAYGSIDGESLTVSHRYLTEILKEEYGFDGFVVTDWENFRSTVNGQHIFDSMDDACVAGVVAGNDMSMNSHEFRGALLQAVKDGRISEDVINNAVRRILSVKARLGLLDEENESVEKPDRNVIGCKEHQAYNEEVAVKSVVLLKNNGVLPLQTQETIAVLGPNADDIRAQYGDWTYFSHPLPKPNETGKDGAYTLLKGMQARYGADKILYAKGCSVLGDESEDASEKMMQEGLAVASMVDTVVVAIGDVLQQNGEWRDRANLVLSGRQIELVKRVKELGKKVIVVLINGKPLELKEVEEYADAIIEAFNGGDMGGLAVAKLIKGEANFSGRLPISFPYSSATMPCYYNQYDYWHGGKYVDVPAGALYPFGFGLSYHQCEYSEPVISKPTAKIGEKTEICVKITNKSNVDGIETVQLYFKDKVCKILTPVRSLLDFQRVNVPAGETKKVCFTVDTQKLGYYNRDCEYKVDAGAFTFYLTGDGKNFAEIPFEIVEK